MKVLKKGLTYWKGKKVKKQDLDIEIENTITESKMMTERNMMTENDQ